MRVPCDTNPFPTMEMPGLDEARACPARWIWHPDVRTDEPQVLLFRLPFDLEQPVRTRLHVSADQRYELFLDGVRLGRGPERGDPGHWSFETYELDLAAGSHLLAARAWWLPTDGSPMAQMSVLPGFLALAEGELAKTLSTGSGAWQVLATEALSRETSPVTARTYYVVGWSFRMDGACWPWGWNNDPKASGDWVAPRVGRPPAGGNSNPYYSYETSERWHEQHLTPAMLPPMMEETRQLGRVRHAEFGSPEQPFEPQVCPERRDADLAARWQDLLAGRAALTLAAGQRVRVVVDLDNYYCAFPELVTSGGAGTEVTLAWAESLFDVPLSGWRFSKGNRDAVDGKYFFAPADRFVLEGGNGRSYDTLWWRAGRYVEVTVIVGETPLVVEALRWRETRYPVELEASFEASDPRLAAAIPMMFRSLQMCSHETFMDCPYYEQLMYAGDGRLETLVTYLSTADTRLPTKANALFDWSRAADGLTKSRYPSEVPQVIPPFSLWWVSMVHDFFLWRNRPEIVRRWLPGVDTVLTAFADYLQDDLVVAPQGWNYCDWVPTWHGGWPPDGVYGANALINLQYLYALDRAVEMHTAMGQPHLAAHWSDGAARLRQAIVAAFWDEERGMLADDRAHANYSEHVQSLAILTQLLDGERRERLAQGLLEAPDLARTTIYFSHYLLEALRELGAMERFFDRLGFWFELSAQGFKTTLESPEPSRSDCHAWGAHPIYHYFASILGARPDGPGFRAVRIRPQLGSLTWLRGAFPHPDGEMLRFDLHLEGGALRGEITLPPDVPGTLEWGGATLALHPGRNVL